MNRIIILAQRAQAKAHRPGDRRHRSLIHEESALRKRRRE
jgi:hypothetical protein